MKSVASTGAANWIAGSLALAQIAGFASALRAQETEEQASLRREAIAAWDHRAASVKSLALKADVEHFERGKGIRSIDPEDPFAEGGPVDDQTIKVTLDYAQEQGKIAYARLASAAEQSTPGVTVYQSFRGAFDGQKNSVLYLDGKAPRGVLSKKGVPEDVLAKHIDLTAVRHWLAPADILRGTGGFTGNISVEEQLVETDGVRCRRFRLKGSQFSRDGVIDCDPERGWVPICIKSWREGKPVTSLTIKYEDRENKTALVKAWEFSLYDEHGKLEERRRGVVRECQVNCDVDDSRFSIELPIGTPVSEKVGDRTRNLIQGADGLQLLEGGEPGSDKADDPFGAIDHRRSRVAAKFVALAERAAQPGAMTPDQLRATDFVEVAANDSLDDFTVEPWHRGHWTIKDGVINYDGKGENKAFQKNSLWTKKGYGDLQMYAEWRLPEKPTMKPHPIVLYNGDFLLDDDGKRVTRLRLDAGDSGLMFRGTSNCQANIWSQELGSGEINGYRTNHKMPQAVRRACIPIKNADRPLGEWNTFLVTIQGDRMSVDTNGERVINEAELPELPKSGPIGLQHHGDPVQFRNLWVKEL